MNEAGNHVSRKFREYARPLIQGQVKVPIGPDGLPNYVRLKRKLIPQKCAPWKK
jgi:6-phosphofructokinase 1